MWRPSRLFSSPSRWPVLQRFAFSASINFVSSYGAYLLLLAVVDPSISYFIAFFVGMLIGSFLHVRITHRKRLDLANLCIQCGLQIGVGAIASAANGCASQWMDPRLSGLVVICISSGLSFMASRRLLR